MVETNGLPNLRTSVPTPTPPPNEKLRLDTLATLGLAGSTFTPDPMLNSICKTISKLLAVPIAGVTVVQDKQLFLRAAAGIDADFSCGRDGAFCSWTLMPSRPEVLVVENALKDPRFAKLEVVDKPDGLRFYAGAPLVASNGTRLGAVCIFDTKPRKMKAEEFNMLSNFSEIAVRRLEEREFKKLKTEDNQKLARSEPEIGQPIVLCDVSANRWWSLLYCNAAFTQVTGIAVDNQEHSEKGFWKLFRAVDPMEKTKILEQVEDIVREGKDFTVNVMRRDSSDKHAFEMHFRPATTANLSGRGSSISVPNIVAAAEIGDSAFGYYFATVKEIEQLTAQRVSGSRVSERKAGVPHATQHTFMSDAQSLKHYGSGPEHRNEGMRDVTMGVLCSNGPNGLVYRARWKKRSVSVRVVEAKASECSLHDGFGTQPVPFEAAVSLKIDHPNIVTTYKVIVEDSPPASGSSEKMVLAWMVREWCGRGSLSDAMLRGWLRRDGKVDTTAVLGVAQEVASALACLHSQGVIHGDISPDSVLLVDETGASAKKHKDFVAKISGLGYCVPASQPGARIGSQSHAAPELLSKGTLSEATDVYALGMLLWETFTGQAVWPSLNISQLQRRVVAAKEKPLMPRDMPIGLKALIEECLDADPSRRPSAASVVEELRKLCLEEAAGQLMSALAVAPEKKSAMKLFKLNSEKNRKAAAANAPSKEPSQATLPSSSSFKEGGKAKEAGKSLLKRLISSIK